MARVTPKTMERIRNLAGGLAGRAGLTVERVDVVREPEGWYLRVTVSRPGGVRVSDCERLARPLSQELDRMEHLLPPSYFLEVCSPGTSTWPEEESG